MNLDVIQRIAEDAPVITHDVVIYIQSIKGSGATVPGTRNSVLFVEGLAIDGEAVPFSGKVSLTIACGDEGFVHLELYEVEAEHRAWLERFEMQVHELDPIRERFTPEQVAEESGEDALRLLVRSLDLRYS